MNYIYCYLLTVKLCILKDICSIIKDGVKIIIGIIGLKITIISVDLIRVSSNTEEILIYLKVHNFNLLKKWRLKQEKKLWLKASSKKNLKIIIKKK